MVEHPISEANLIAATDVRQLAEAVEASKADFCSKLPVDASDSQAALKDESSKSAQKRPRNDLNDECERGSDCSSKRVRKVVIGMGAGGGLNVVHGGAMSDHSGGYDDDDDRDDLRSCTVKPADINTTFDDVHVSPDAIEALKIFKLLIEDPEAFTFGILSRSAPPGVLLYGPPGTGKTLIVKALAKQAHATFLKFSGADIRSKYVGEGEKKIKHIFAYARKHHPCVIFIDEADSIFRSRSAEDNTKGHLANINQFLEEMDGMNSNIRNPIVIAATNRPFDIDEGILRRLGRRVLIDIPNPDARKKIFDIHLKDEPLADDVNLSEIVKVTQGYTGSDIKNLIYAAALAALSEGVDRKQKGSKLPEGAIDSQKSSRNSRRVLYRGHFLQASREIRAAPAAETVKAIRNFHDKFGNTAQRAAGSDSQVEAINVTNDPVYA